MQHALKFLTCASLLSDEPGRKALEMGSGVAESTVMESEPGGAKEMA